MSGENPLGAEIDRLRKEKESLLEGLRLLSTVSVQRRSILAFAEEEGIDGLRGRMERSLGPLLARGLVEKYGGRT